MIRATVAHRRDGLFVARSSSTLGNVLTVNVFKPGLFSASCALSAEPSRSATVVEMRAGRTRQLHRGDLDQIRLGPAGLVIDHFLMSVLIERNRLLTAQLIELLFTPAVKRVRRQLVHLAQLGIVDDGDGWIRISQEELSMMNATTRATVNRVLRDLEKRGSSSSDAGVPASSIKPGCPAPLVDTNEIRRRSSGVITAL